MTDQTKTRAPQFYLTPAGPCPYLPGLHERKVFAKLDGEAAAAFNSALTQSGFRRSQTIAYKPACEGCSACISVRIPVATFVFSHNQKRVFRRNADLVREMLEPLADREQYALLHRYLDTRHAGGGMNGMNLFEYATMVEETPVDTRLFAYRLPASQGTELIGCVITDVLEDGLSMVYSFFHPEMNRRSLGTFMILDHVRIARAMGLAYVYLGYWVQGSPKMRYKGGFRPLEALVDGAWVAVKDTA